LRNVERKVQKGEEIDESKVGAKKSEKETGDPAGKRSNFLGECISKMKDSTWQVTKKRGGKKNEPRTLKRSWVPYNKSPKNPQVGAK